MRELIIKEIASVSFVKEQTTQGLTNRVELEELLKQFGAIRIEAKGIIIHLEAIRQNQFSSAYEAKANLEINLDCSE
jgi:hypothetical protein